jgi:hypothetical protein
MPDCIVLVPEMYDYWLLTFHTNNKYESFPGYLPKLEFKYFEIQLFHVNSCCSSDYRNIWLQDTFSKINDS